MVVSNSWNSCKILLMESIPLARLFQLSSPWENNKDWSLLKQSCGSNSYYATVLRMRGVAAVCRILSFAAPHIFRMGQFCAFIFFDRDGWHMLDRFRENELKIQLYKRETNLCVLHKITVSTPPLTFSKWSHMLGLSCAKEWGKGENLSIDPPDGRQKAPGKRIGRGRDYGRLNS